VVQTRGCFDALWFDRTWGRLSLHGCPTAIRLAEKAFEQRELGLSKTADYGLHAAEAVMALSLPRQDEKEALPSMGERGVVRGHDQTFLEP